MKQFIAILICLLLVLSSATPQVVADEAPACEGCGCATMTCCPDDSTPADPVPHVPERVQTQKISAVQSIVASNEIAPDTHPFPGTFSHRATTVPNVPLFIRNCQFLI